MDNRTYTIRLGDNDIEEIINGRSVSRELSDGTKIIVEQSLFKDVMLPMLDNPNKVVNVHQEARKQEFLSQMRNDTFNLRR